MNIFKKAFGVAVALTIAVTSLAGCGNGSGPATGETKKLTYWTGNSASTYVTNYDEATSIAKLQEKFGIDIEFIHPSASRWSEQFNIMIASNEYTDIINQNSWDGAYNGGLPAAYKDGVIIDLTEYLDAGKMPNYKKLLEKYPEVDLSSRTVDGKLFSFGTIKDSAEMNASLGPIVRKDWLDKLGLEAPDTIGDWYNMLKAFKTQDPNGNGKADEIPFGEYSSQLFSMFCTAYNVGTGFYYDANGELVYGPTQPGYKEFITEMNKWYNEGLIDPEFAAIARSNLNANVTNGLVGALVGYVGSSMGTYLGAMEKDPNFDLVGVKWPRHDENSKRYVARDTSDMGGGASGAVVTTACKDPELAVRFLDYMYSEEATEILNWGVEGETFTKENGEYKFTDAITNNPDGLTFAEAVNEHVFPSLGVPNKYWLNSSYSEVQYRYPQQKAAPAEWIDGDVSLVNLRVKMTAEENARRSQITADTTPYEDEMFTKMIIGKEPISKFDEYVDTMNKYGLTELTEIYKSAAQRYEQLKAELK